MPKDNVVWIALMPKYTRNAGKPWTRAEVATLRQLAAANTPDAGYRIEAWPSGEWGTSEGEPSWNFTKASESIAVQQINVDSTVSS